MINVDGAANKDGKAGCWRILRDNSGSSLVVELWGVLEGLRFAMWSGCKIIELQTDNKIISEAMDSRKPIIKEESGILHQIKECLNNNWEGIIKHVHIEVNQCADVMANMSLHHDLDLQIYHENPDNISDLLVR